MCKHNGIICKHPIAAGDYHVLLFFIIFFYRISLKETVKEVSIMIFDNMEDNNPVKDYEYEETHFNIVKEFKVELLDIKNKSDINVYELINICIMNYLANLEELVEEYTLSEAMDILKRPQHLK